MLAVLTRGQSFAVDGMRAVGILRGMADSKLVYASVEEFGAVLPCKPKRPAGLAQDSQGRKDQPIFRGFLRYFPDATAEVCELSRLGNEKHNPGQDMHWARSKSGDELDCVARHLLECLDADGNSTWIEGEYSKPVRHLTALAWRALAALQKQIEKERGDGKISPGSRP